MGNRAPFLRGRPRRTFSADYKRRILAEADACPRGQVGALLRREGLYYSHLTKWRGEREAGTLADRPRGPRPNPDRAQLDRLAQENAALKRKLEQAEAIIEAQKRTDSTFSRKQVTRTDTARF